MIRPYKNRMCDMTRRVQVYRNLNNQKFSITQDKLVVGHADSLVLAGCVFLVQEKGRQRVIRDQKKNVHAYVNGLLCAPGFQVDRSKFPVKERIRYNPYEMDMFQNLEGKTVNGAPYVELDNQGHMYIYH